MRVLTSLTLLAACGLAITNADVAAVGKTNSAIRQKSVGKLSKNAANVVDFSRVTDDVTCVAVASVAPPAPSAQAQTLKMVGLFVLWYGFNAGYNVYNAYVKRDFQYPFAIATLQLLIGLVYAVPLWFLGIRKMPNLNMDDFMRLLPIAMLNAAGHACAVNAMFEKGGGSFTHGISIITCCDLPLTHVVVQTHICSYRYLSLYLSVLM